MNNFFILCLWEEVTYKREKPASEKLVVGPKWYKYQTMLQWKNHAVRNEVVTRLKYQTGESVL